MEYRSPYHELISHLRIEYEDWVRKFEEENNYFPKTEDISQWEVEKELLISKKFIIEKSGESWAAK